MKFIFIPLLLLFNPKIRKSAKEDFFQFNIKEISRVFETPWQDRL